jgi:hypothetical protein
MEIALSKQELMQVTPSSERHTLAVLQGKKGQVRRVLQPRSCCAFVAMAV